MRRDPEQERIEGAAEAIRPGTISVLLRDLARAPEVELRGEGPPPLAPGARIGRFELVREIGRGGFGVVWEARDAELRRDVALKLLRPRGDVPAPEDRLLAEAEAAARLSHPNIVTLYDAGRSERGPYLVLELLRGETLAQRLDAGGVTPREAVRIAAELAQGLAHAHARGLVHRDLKPGNVFLCDDGHVKLLDLGLAHAFGRPKPDGGTPAYMAPEQARGAPEDERTDVFTLGVILYRMLAGELPFPGDASLRGSRPAPPLAFDAAPGVPTLVARMLAKDPVERPRSAGEVAPRLATALRELDGSGDVGRATVRRSSRSWRLVAVAAAAVLAAVGLHVRGPRPAAAPPAGARESSIAVLPFADLSAEHDQEHFAIGISDEIRNTLARVAGLRVIGRTSSVALRGKGEDARTIAEKLGISALLDGSIRKAGSRVRVAVELIEASRGTQLWSAMYDRDLADVLAVQVEIARQVVAALDVRIQTGGLAAVPERPSTSPAAYEAYLLGNLRSQESSPELPAEEMYQRAVSLDPGYAPAWAQLAASLVQWSQYVSESPDVRRRRFERAAAAADQAIALAPRLPDGYEARALVRYAFLWDWAGALADAERAVALGPGRPVAHRRYSMVLDRFGESEKALEQLRTALELDPLDGITLNNLTVGYMSAGRLDLARRALDRAFEIAPRGAPVMWMTAAELALAEGRPAEALALFERNPVESNRLIGRVFAHHALGDDRASRAALAELTARYGANDPFLVAVAHAERGECDLVVDWVDRGVAQHGRGINYVHAGLRKCAAKDPRYVPLLRKLNLPVPAPR